MHLECLFGNNAVGNKWYLETTRVKTIKISIIEYYFYKKNGEFHAHTRTSFSELFIDGPQSKSIFIVIHGS